MSGDRDTCLSKVCENTQLMASAFQKAGTVKTDDLKQIVSDLICNEDSQKCMYDNCSKCKDSKFSFERQRVEF